MARQNGHGRPRKISHRQPPSSYLQTFLFRFPFLLFLYLYLFHFVSWTVRNMFTSNGIKIFTGGSLRSIVLSMGGLSEHWCYFHERAWLCATQVPAIPSSQRSLQDGVFSHLAALLLGSRGLECFQPWNTSRPRRGIEKRDRREPCPCHGVRARGRRLHYQHRLRRYQHLPHGVVYHDPCVQNCKCETHHRRGTQLPLRSPGQKGQEPCTHHRQACGKHAAEVWVRPCHCEFTLASTPERSCTYELLVNSHLTLNRPWTCMRPKYKDFSTFQ